MKALITLLLFCSAAQAQVTHSTQDKVLQKSADVTWSDNRRIDLLDDKVNACILDYGFDSVGCKNAIKFKAQRDSMLKIESAPLIDTIPFFITYTDTAGLSFYQDMRRISFTEIDIEATYGYAVREKHNTSEGVIDPGFYGKERWQDYYKITGYLTADKKPWPDKSVIWFAKEVKYRHP